VSADVSHDPVVQTDRFASARLVADAVLYEGYVLYPYRASAQKNQLRWQFGVLAPPDYARSSGAERWSMCMRAARWPRCWIARSVSTRHLWSSRRGYRLQPAAPSPCR